ncbi:MAG: MMPL family transporter [Nitrospinae bacterium]|nr:MMPL family transporter [Nitrospinota bacterium]
MKTFPGPTRNKLGVRDKLLLCLARMVERHPVKIIVFCVLLSIISVVYTYKNLTFQTGRNELVSQDLRYNQNFKKYREEFGNYDGLIVVAKGEDPDRLKEYMDVLGAEIQTDPAHFMDIFYKIDTGYFKDKLFLFLKEKEIKDLFGKLKENEDMISRLNEEPGLENLFRQINFKISEAMVGHLVSGLMDSGKEEGEEKSSPADLSLLNNLLRQMKERLDGNKNYKSPWTGFLNKQEEAAEKDGYFSSENKKIFMMTVNPVKKKGSFTSAKEPLYILRDRIAALRADFPDIEAGVTGVAALETDETVDSQSDNTKATIISLIGVTLAFIFAFRGIVKPLLATIALVASICWTLGLTTLFIGHLNLISAVFLSILIGLGIDYGVHILMRYEEERLKKSSSIEVALEAAIRGTGKGILVGALTMALSFYTMVFADFRGIVELGIIAGSGVLLCLAAMLTFLPAMLVAVDRKHVREGLFNVFDRPDVTLHLDFLKFLLRFPVAVLVAGGLWAAYSGLLINKVKFDFNLLRLQNKGTESVRFEQEIINNAERSTWYGAITADSIDQARGLKKELEKLSTVGDIESVFSVYPEGQEEKIQLVRAERGSIPSFPPPARGELNEVNTDDLKKTLKKISFKLREEGGTWAPGQKPEEGSIREAKMLMEEVTAKLEGLGAGAAPLLAAYQKRLFVDYEDKFSTLEKSMDPSPIELEELPKPIKDRFIGKTGKYLLQIFPREFIWDKEPLDRFIADLRTLDPDVTGLAVQSSESAARMKDGYVQGGVYAFIAIVLITFLSFSKPKDALLSMVPFSVGFIWLIGLMEVFDLRFNLANLVILPLITGIGIDNGIHIVERYHEGDVDDPVSIIFLSTGKALFLCSFNNMIGFGSLMVSRHYGIFSIGLLLTLGIGSVLLASCTVLPVLIRLFEKKKIP